MNERERKKFAVASSACVSAVFACVRVRVDCRAALQLVLRLCPCSSLPPCLPRAINTNHRARAARRRARAMDVPCCPAAPAHVAAPLLPCSCCCCRCRARAHPAQRRIRETPREKRLDHTPGCPARQPRRPARPVFCKKKSRFFHGRRRRNGSGGGHSSGHACPGTRALQEGSSTHAHSGRRSGRLSGLQLSGRREWTTAVCHEMRRGLCAQSAPEGSGDGSGPLDPARRRGL